MALFSTIAHTGAPSIRQGTSKWRRVFGATLLAVAVAGFGSAAVFDFQASPTSATVTNSRFLSHEEFVRLNTIELPVLASGDSGDLVRGYPIPYWKSTTPQVLGHDAASEDPARAAFIELNTTSLEYPARGYVEPEAGPR